MNILFLDQYSALGGAQQCLLDLLPAIEERGWNSRVAVPPGGPLVDRLRAQGIRVDAIRSGPYRSGRKSVTDLVRFATDIPAQVATIARLLDQSPTDLLYVNGPRLLIAAALAARGRVPILFHAHHIVGQSSAAYLEGLALRHSGATVVGCCDAAAQPLRRWVAPERIHAVPNGTADRGFRDRSFEPGREVRIGFVGRVAQDKGAMEFLHAAAILKQSVPHARFTICGAPLFGDRDYYHEVLKLAADLSVEVLEWQDDVGAVMRGLDVLVMPSKEEGMPRVLLEALSAGLVVVAFPVGGIPEVIDDGINGFLVPSGSAVDLARKLEDLLQFEPEKLRTTAHGARRKWELRYTVAAYRAGITNLLEPYATRETTARPLHKSGLPRPVPKDTRSA
jgi:glycosyltransferase involved in cell wall biosynthesis